MKFKYEGRRKDNSDERRHYVEPIHPWRWRALTVWIIVFTCLTAYAIHHTNSTRAAARKEIALSIFQNCKRNGQLLTALIRPGIKNTTKLDYYKTHPTERALVLKQIHEALAMADPKHCENLPSQKYNVK